MLFDRKTTEFYTRTRPGCYPLDLSQVPLESVSALVKKALEGDGIGYAPSSYVGDTPKIKLLSPEDSALSFYLLNHAVGVISQKVGPHECMSPAFMGVYDDYCTLLQLSATRMFYYLLLICTRESRHAKSATDVLDQFPKEISSFYYTFKGENSGDAVNALKNAPPKVGLGMYCNFLVKMFMECKYSSSFGGKAWGAIAKVLHSFVRGAISPEVMVDTAFTLCHNNGPIFNKGMLFHNYSSATIVKILDVQRSGQIPQLIHSKGVSYGDWVSRIHTLLTYTLPDHMKGVVDWKLVESLGSVNKYPSEIASMKSSTASGTPSHKPAKVHHGNMGSIPLTKEEVDYLAGIATMDENDVHPFSKVGNVPGATPAKKVSMIHTGFMAEIIKVERS